MVDPTQNRGETGRPIGPEPEKKEEVDPEKFKKVLKVEKSDEAEKRQQRRLSKGQEEGDEDEDVEEKAAPPPPTSSFAEFMEDKNELDDLFDAESPGIRRQAAPQTSMQAPAPGSISTEGVELEEEPTAQPQAQPSPYQPQTTAEQPPTEQAPPQQQQPQTPQPSYGSETQQDYPSSYQGTVPQTPTYPTDQSQTDQGEDQTDYTQPQQQTQPTEDKSQQQDKKKEQEDASLLASQPAKDALKSKKKSPSKPAPRVETVAPKEEEPEGPTPLKGEESTEGRHPTEKPSTPPPLKEEETTTGKPLKEEPKAQEPFPHSGEESIMPTMTAPPAPTGAEKGEQATEKPLEAPIAGEAKPSPELKGVPIPEEGKEEPDSLTPGVSAKKGTAIPSEEISQQAPLRKKTTDQMTFERFTPEQIRDKKMGKSTTLPAGAQTMEGFATPTIPEEGMDMMGEGKKQKKDDFPFINSEQLTAALPPSEQVLPSVTPPADVPAYSKLSPETYELFEKMVGTVIIQDHSGVTSTTITLNMPNSIFNGAQVTFDQYSTAPNSYNLKLVGTPEAVEAFSSNAAELVAAFKQGQHAFEVNLLKPVLEGKKPLIRRKSAAGDGGSGDKGKQ